MDYNFDDFVNTTKNYVEKAGQKTVEIIDITKLKWQISELKNKLNRDYIILGKKTFKSIENDDSDFIDDSSEIIDNIREKKQAIEELNERLKELKGTQKCENCGESNDKYSKYCKKCGDLL